MLDWSELGVSGLLPTGTVTLLLADVEGSTRLWETQPERDDRGLCASEPSRVVISSPPMAACARSSRVRVTVLWRRSPARPTRWPARWSCSGRRWRRSGCASGCIPARCSCAMRATTPVRRSTARRGCAIWPTAARPCCRARPKPLVVDRLPAGAWLTDLGSHPLRGVPRPERVVQLCHPDLRNEFPPLRVRQQRCLHPSSGAADQFRGPRRGADRAAGAAGARTGW